MAGSKQSTRFWQGLKFSLILLLFAAVLPEDAAQAQQLAFPGADGFGKYTTGGRGGTIYRVTNLNNSGPGSFRNGVEMKGARTIVLPFQELFTLQANFESAMVIYPFSGKQPPAMASR